MCITCNELNPSHPNTYYFHRRVHPPVQESDFNKRREDRPYFPALREDFHYTCCYCSLHEAEFGGWRNFETDHFEFVIFTPGLKAVYTNLLYACRVCNNYKRKGALRSEEWARGLRYVNPCEGDLHSRHIVQQADGGFKGLTPEGEFMVKRLRLGGKDIRKDWQRCRLARREQEELFQRRQRQLQENIANIEQLLKNLNLDSSLKNILVQFKTEFERMLADMPMQWRDTLQPSPFP